MMTSQLTNAEIQQVQSFSVPAEDMSDEEIIRRFKDGDLDAYAGIMRRYNQQVFRVARCFVSNDAAAMDVVQEAHIKAITKIGDFKGQSSFISWLYAITRNEALMYLRKHKTERSMKLVDIDSLDALVEDKKSDLSIASKNNIPDAALENLQLKELINQYVDGLPEDFRVVFVLRAIEKQSVKETAEILQIKEDTVKTRFFRAKRLLRQKIQNFLDSSGMQVYEFGGEHCDLVVHNILSIIRSTY